MRRAFTLVELLVVITILAILAALLFPVFARAKASAKQTQCLSNLHQIGVAIQLYMSDSDDFFPHCVDASDKYAPQIWNGQAQWQAQIPDIPLINVALQPYAKSQEIFHCPSDTGTKTLDADIGIPFPTSPSLFQQYGCSYLMRTEIVFDGLSGTAFATPADINVLFDGAGNWHGSGRPLQPNDNDSTIGPLVSGYRYNTLFGDYHAKNVSSNQLGTAWNLPLQ
jgi:general secretion pathway protein G